MSSLEKRVEALESQTGRTIIEVVGSEEEAREVEERYKGQDVELIVAISHISRAPNQEAAR